MAAAAPVAAGLGAASALFGGVSSYQQGKAQKKQAYADAAATQANRRLEAERIRKQTRQVQSTARAQAAENGLDVDVGAPAVINDQIAFDGEQDAWMTILTGQNEAKALQVAGKNAASAGRTALGMGLLNAGASAADGYSKWKGARK